MKNLKIIAFTHKSVGLEKIGSLCIEDGHLQQRLTFLKESMRLRELMYLTTCNRAEFITVSDHEFTQNTLVEFFTAFNPAWDKEKITWAAQKAIVYEGEEALLHLFSVASSIDSLVVGEREIITQVRNAYEICNKYGLTGDFIRLLAKKTIEAAKQVYTHTNIAKNSVSVVSLAWRRLKELNVKPDARFLIIGAGQTNSTMAKYLKKHGFKNFTVFNRTLANAYKLAAEINAEAYPLSDLPLFKKDFDVIVTCTGATGFVISKEIYTELIGDDKSRKIVIDLAIPNDLDPEILNSYDVNLIAINNLQAIAAENLHKRQQELESCTHIIKKNMEEFKKAHKARKVELAMQQVPEAVKQIRQIALNEVFAKDVNMLDKPSKEVLEKVLAYMEKKYISVPMKMAREILVKD